MPSNPRRGVPGPLVLIAVVVVVAALWLGNRRLDRVMHPWADGHRGAPVLMGTWVGQLTTGGGRPRVVIVDMLREKDSTSWLSDRHCYRCEANLVGTARTCDERGRVWQYRLSGKVDDRRATRIAGGFQPRETPAPNGLSMSAFHGAWDGADALALEAEFYWRRGVSAISSTADPDTKGFVPLPMRRATDADFRARCERIRGPAIAEVVP